MRVYLAGPMTGCPEWNFPAFEDTALSLRLRGYSVWSPAERDLAAGFDPASDGADFDLAEALRADVEAVLTCDVVGVLPGFEASAGTLVEVLTAAAAGIPWAPVADLLKHGSGQRISVALAG